MTKDDIEYINQLIKKNMFSGTVLELGGGYGGDTCRPIVESNGLAYQATDLFAAKGIDFVADFETGEGIEELLAAGPFGTTLVLNVLEHTFNPIAVLDNALRVTSKGGLLVALTPALWPIHNYPIDCCRLLPDWYRRFAETRGATLVEDSFQYVGYGHVAESRSPDGQDTFPLPGFHNPIHRFYSRAVHKVMNTFGRGMTQPTHVAIAAAFLRN